ncbi:hypothetical protein LTR62_005722 [Meristemomyces frigidus]|uniref:UBC core domain-containing protein n=1 Tax=Meristemomyces frigidus TaxID=1508187 RepID=A0AAN7TD57_9PEZI|nr:hypothetical protein LTR62_005722 [Meristemomyces frigidus]
MDAEDIRRKRLRLSKDSDPPDFSSSSRPLSSNNRVPTIYQTEHNNFQNRTDLTEDSAILPPYATPSMDTPPDEIEEHYRSLRCAKCNTALLPSPFETISKQFEQQIRASQRAATVIKGLGDTPTDVGPATLVGLQLVCKRCHDSHTCFGCGNHTRQPKFHASGDGIRFEWHCDPARLMLIWFLLVSYDSLAKHEADPAEKKKLQPSHGGGARRPRGSGVPKGVGYGGGERSHWTEELDDVPQYLVEEDMLHQSQMQQQQLIAQIKTLKEQAATQSHPEAATVTHEAKSESPWEYPYASSHYPSYHESSFGDIGHALEQQAYEQAGHVHWTPPPSLGTTATMGIVSPSKSQMWMTSEFIAHQKPQQLPGPPLLTEQQTAMLVAQELNQQAHLEAQAAQEQSQQQQQQQAQQPYSQAVQQMQLDSQAAHQQMQLEYRAAQQQQDLLQLQAMQQQAEMQTLEGLSHSYIPQPLNAPKPSWIWTEPLHSKTNDFAPYQPPPVPFQIPPHAQQVPSQSPAYPMPSFEHSSGNMPSSLPPVLYLPTQGQKPFSHPWTAFNTAQIPPQLDMEAMLAEAHRRVTRRHPPNLPTAEDPDDGLTSQVMAALVLLLPSLKAAQPTALDKQPPVVLKRILYRSSLLDRAAELLRNDSIEEATRRGGLYESVVAFVRVLGTHYSLMDTVLGTRWKRSGNLIRQDTADCEESTPSLLACMQGLITQSRMIIKQASKCAEEFNTEDGKKLLSTAKMLHGVASLLEPEAPLPSRDMAFPTVTAWTQDNAMMEIKDEILVASHAYGAGAKQAAGPARGSTRPLMKEITRLKTSLPQGIWVRYGESRIDLMKILIAGPQGTPYANGLWEFDLMCGADYPVSPPKVLFKTTGGGTARVNPNLYEDGKVCLSLLGTWQGEPWRPGQSTILQVLVSIQAMIFCDEPHCNEPSYERQRGSERSKEYNRRVYTFTVGHAMLEWLEPGVKPVHGPPGTLRQRSRSFNDVGAKKLEESIWKDIVIIYFKEHKETILSNVDEWTKDKPMPKPKASRRCRGGSFLSVEGGYVLGSASDVETTTDMSGILLPGYTPGAVTNSPAEEDMPIGHALCGSSPKVAESTEMLRISEPRSENLVTRLREALGMLKCNAGGRGRH